MKVFLLFVGTHDDKRLERVYPSVSTAVKWAIDNRESLHEESFDGPSSIEEWEVKECGGNQLNTWYPLSSNPNIWEKYKV